MQTTMARTPAKGLKAVRGVSGAAAPHWVGDGFPVRTLFGYDDAIGRHASPFLLFDHAGPADFTPAERPRGVGQHPHRGFETVTIVFDGELEHRDSTGAGGRIGPGDVQWMTAASGILHEEFHSREFTRRGGTLEMVQLWVNLPARDKSAAPGYQTLLSDQIPTVDLPDGAGTLRVIAGAYGGSVGPARTFTPIDVWDVKLHRDRPVDLTLPHDRPAVLAVLRGTVLVNGEQIAREAQSVLLGPDGGAVSLEANGEAQVLLLSGEPIDEPVVGHGPFVMNTREEITEAIRDFQSGRFGAMPA